jgi:hypothetical protein
VLQGKPLMEYEHTFHLICKSLVKKNSLSDSANSSPSLTPLMRSLSAPATTPALDLDPPRVINNIPPITLGNNNAAYMNNKSSDEGSGETAQESKKEVIAIKSFTSSAPAPSSSKSTSVSSSNTESSLNGENINVNNDPTLTPSLSAPVAPSVREEAKDNNVIAPNATHPVSMSSASTLPLSPAIDMSMLSSWPFLLALQTMQADYISSNNNLSEAERNKFASEKAKLMQAAGELW